MSLIATTKITLKNFPQYLNRTDVANGVEVVTKVSQHRPEKIDPATTVQGGLLAGEKGSKKSGVLGLEAVAVRPDGSERTLADVEPTTGRPLPLRSEPEVATKADQKIQMEVSNPLLSLVEAGHGIPDELEQGRVRLDLANQAVQQLGNEQSNGTFTDVERNTCQGNSRVNLPQAVHLGPGRDPGLQLDKKQRLQQRLPTVNHITLAAVGVGQNPSNTRPLPILQCVENNPASGVTFQ